MDIFLSCFINTYRIVKMQKYKINLHDFLNSLSYVSKILGKMEYMSFVLVSKKVEGGQFET